jgi:baseplate J-like protein
VIYFCSQQNRRALVLQHPALNGIEYLEVCDSGSDCECGRKLLVTLLKDARSIALTTAQIKITGGGAEAKVRAVNITAATADSPETFTVVLDTAGDFSTYTFTLVANPATADPPGGFDPQLSSVDFSFKAGCDSAGDCAPDTCCPPKLAAEPDINYLAKEFDGFNQVMLDRLAVLVPNWRETHPSDMDVAFVEALAYLADHLSYQQDAIGTEAYIGTARSRISMRRLAKLVDYKLDEGANARTWVHVDATQNGVVIPAGTALYPRVPGLATAIQPGIPQIEQLSTALAFETMQMAVLFQEQNEINFYTWSDANCCLPAGSTQATLKNHFTRLQAGMVLVFEEKIGPNTGDSDDADPLKRWPVRITKVQQFDHLNRPLVDPLDETPITRIWWDPADALPFPLCISSTTDAAHGAHAITDVSVALGNIIPADHGVWQDWEDLGAVPPAPPAPIPSASCTCGSTDAIDTPRTRYFPKLSQSPLTFAATFNGNAPASALVVSSGTPTAQLCVRDDRMNPWTVLEDLLSSHEADRAVVHEIERDGTVFLRFGDGTNGMSADAAASFQARYRTGNGSMGNIGHDTLAHVVTNITGIRSLRNPIAAAGGRDPETMEHIRQVAPYAFRSQLRAVTEDDYGVMAQRDPAIREARGTLRWTGSWYTAFVSLDAASADVPSAALVTSTKDRLNLFRMIGTDLEVEGAVIVGLRIEMNICVDMNHFQSDVRDAITAVFTTGILCSGQRGILNPENFTFGQTIYASPLIAAAQAVDGVVSATLTVFQRMDDPSVDGSAQGFLTIHRLEIARCDNDPNRLDHGILVLHMDGGR